jgi:putative SOS response-associated peptidase YedK
MGKTRREGQGEAAYRITLKSGEPFGFAGPWENWGKGAERITSQPTAAASPGRSGFHLRGRHIKGSGLVAGAA